MKIALTGGATGIGAAVLELMRRQGHDITVFDIRVPQASDVTWIKTDLSNEASISDALTQAVGPYDALINNAGLPPRDGMAQLVLQVNYYGMKRFLTGMLPALAPGASIVTVASRAGAHWRENIEQVKALMATPVDGLADFIERHNINPTRAYTLSKEAVIVLTMAMTENMQKQGFRINSVSPAAVNTDILKDFERAFGDRVAQNVARVGRAGDAREIAEVIAFLASPASGWIKGQDIVIDGGMSAIAAVDALDLPQME